MHIFRYSQETCILENFRNFLCGKEIINNDTKELEEIVFSSYTSIVEKDESYAATLMEKDYKTLKQSIEDQRKKWHYENDKFVNNLQNEIDEMRDIQLKAPNKDLQNVKELCSGCHQSKQRLAKIHQRYQNTFKQKQKFIIELLSRKAWCQYHALYRSQWRCDCRNIVRFSIMERREVLDLLEWIPVRELFDQPKFNLF